MKRPDKIKLDVVKPPAGLVFAEVLRGQGSIYVQKLNEALSTGGVIQIMLNDAYMRSQLRIAANKVKLKLVFAVQGEFMYVKPISIDGDLKRLMLYLREPRSMPELMGLKLELHLERALNGLAKDELAHVRKEKWQLTEKGLGAL